MENTDLTRGRHVVYNLHAHLVFVPKYRRKIFTSEILQHLKKIFDVVCSKFEGNLVEFNGESNHVHLLISYPPKVSLSKLVNSLKGVSSRMIRQERYPTITQALWKGSLWSPSYFVSSCGGAPLDVLKKYIEKQKVPE
jgi:putative transposase